MNRTILVVAAHPDDEVLGCGGTMARHEAAGDRVVCLILGEGLTSRHASRERGIDRETLRLEELDRDAERAAEVLGTARLEMRGFPDNRFDSVPLLDVVKVIEEIFAEEEPEIVYTHHPGDVNIDHLVTHRAALAVCRQLPGTSLRRLCFFEVPSSSEWQTPAMATAFAPNHFVDVTATLERKIRAMAAYRTESRPWPHPRSAEALEALARWRGSTIGVGAAEAFAIGRQVET